MTPFLHCLLSSSLILTLGACRTLGSHSRPKLETDDREREKTKNLKDVSSTINEFVNRHLEEAREQVNPKGQAWTDDTKMQLIRELGKRLAAPHPGTGLGVYVEEIKLSVEISKLAEIEYHLVQTLKPQTEILRIPFNESCFKENRIGLGAPFISHILPATADHSIAPIVRVGETLMGIDKLGHFAEQGLWYFLASREGSLTSPEERYEFGQYMEGDPRLDKELYQKYNKIYGTYCKVCVYLDEGFGYYGTASTGVCSFADIEANESGFAFYSQVFDNPDDFVFDIADIDTSRWNETIIKSTFSPKLHVCDVEKPVEAEVPSNPIGSQKNNTKRSK